MKLDRCFAWCVGACWCDTMSRIKDLRDLICVSRLTIRESDDEAVFSEEEAKCQELERNTWTSVQVQKSFSDQSHLTSTPDSGFSANGQPAWDSQNSDDESAHDLPPQKMYFDKISTSLGKDFVENPARGNQKKKKTKSRPAQPSISEGPISKTSSLSRLYPSRKAASSLLKNELLSVSHHRVDTRALGDRCGTPSTDFAEGHFEKLLMFVDGGVVSEWLEQSNRNVAELTTWCHTEDNFVHFAHFWLSQFSDKEKFEILRLEYTILLDQLSFAFAAGLNSGEIQHRHLSMFLNAVYREYPAKLMSSQGAHLFLNYLDILSLSKQLQYRELLSDVRCSTRIQQHVQWILATRSFAVVSVWTAVVNFYKKLNGKTDALRPSTPLPDVESESSLYLQRMFASIRSVAVNSVVVISYLYYLISAVNCMLIKFLHFLHCVFEWLCDLRRCGYADVVHYLLRSGKVPPNSCDRQQKSLVFYAVVEKQPKVVRVLLSQVTCSIPSQW